LIPGKYFLSEEEIIKKEKILKDLSDKWKKDRIQRQIHENKLFGFSKNSEIINGRFAMFFLMTGILTEYWTNRNIPAQIEIIIRTLGLL